MTGRPTIALSVPSAGRLLGLGRSQSYALAKQGRIPVRRNGRRVYVDPVEFARRFGVRVDAGVAS